MYLLWDFIRLSIGGRQTCSHRRLYCVEYFMVEHSDKRETLSGHYHANLVWAVWHGSDCSLLACKTFAGGKPEDLGGKLGMDWK